MTDKEKVTTIKPGRQHDIGFQPGPSPFAKAVGEAVAGEDIPDYLQHRWRDLKGVPASDEEVASES